MHIMHKYHIRRLTLNLPYMYKEMPSQPSRFCKLSKLLANSVNGEVKYNLHKPSQPSQAARRVG